MDSAATRRDSRGRGERENGTALKQVGSNANLKETVGRHIYVSRHNGKFESNGGSKGRLLAHALETTDFV